MFDRGVLATRSMPSLTNVSPLIIVMSEQVEKQSSNVAELSNGCCYWGIAFEADVNECHVSLMYNALVTSNRTACFSSTFMPNELHCRCRQCVYSKQRKSKAIGPDVGDWCASRRLQMNAAKTSFRKVNRKRSTRSTSDSNPNIWLTIVGSCISDSTTTGKLKEHRNIVPTN